MTRPRTLVAQYDQFGSSAGDVQGKLRSAAVGLPHMAAARGPALTKAQGIGSDVFHTKKMESLSKLHEVISCPSLGLGFFFGLGGGPPSSCKWAFLLGRGREARFIPGVWGWPSLSFLLGVGLAFPWPSFKTYFIVHLPKREVKMRHLPRSEGHFNFLCNFN